MITLISAVLLVGLMLAGKLGYIPRPDGSDRRRYHDRMFTVINIVDGDTLDIGTADPKTGKPYTRIRLWGVDTPETKRPGWGVMYYGPEASLLTTKLTLNKKVLVSLEPFKNTRGKFGRLLAYIYLPDGKMLNEELIVNGCGYADPRFRHMLSQKFSQLQRQAQKQKLGLWKAVRPEQHPDWYRRRQKGD